MSFRACPGNKKTPRKSSRPPRGKEGEAKGMRYLSLNILSANRALSLNGKYISG
jgi:hypothetical protein